jgi:hypothetical protein
MTIIASALGIIFLVIAGYYCSLAQKVNALKKASAFYNPNRSSNKSESFDHPIMKYSDYKKKFGSRSQDIAIIAPAKQDDVAAIITEFTETMRERGSFIYHFTNYWCSTDNQETQRIVTAAIQNNYHGILTVGAPLTKLAKNSSLTQNKNTPIVFTQVNQAMWLRSQDKHTADHITGIAVVDNWRYRMKMYLYLKPFMRSALIPITNPSLYESVETMVDILRNYGVNAYAVATHSGDDLVQTLSLYVDEVDSVILPRDILPPDVVSKVAK